MYSQISEEKLIEVFIAVDDFIILFEKWLTTRALTPARQPTRQPKLSSSEILTILVYYHHSGYKNFHRAACAVLLPPFGGATDAYLLS